MSGVGWGGARKGGGAPGDAGGAGRGGEAAVVVDGGRQAGAHAGAALGQGTRVAQHA